MVTRQIAAATALYATLALFGVLPGVPDIDLDAGAQAWKAPAAQPYVPETEILHLREENIIP